MVNNGVDLNDEWASYNAHLDNTAHDGSTTFIETTVIDEVAHKARCSVCAYEIVLWVE